MCSLLLKKTVYQLPLRVTNNRAKFYHSKSNHSTTIRSPYFTTLTIFNRLNFPYFLKIHTLFKRKAFYIFPFKEPKQEE